MIIIKIKIDFHLKIFCSVISINLYELYVFENTENKK